MVSQGVIVENKEQQLNFFPPSKTTIDEENVDYKIINEDELDSFVKEMLNMSMFGLEELPGFLKANILHRRGLNYLSKGSN